MGNKGLSSRDPIILSEEEIVLLLDNTSFDRDQIADWHQGFLVNFEIIENLKNHKKNINLWFLNKQKECPTGRMNKENFIKFYTYLYPNGKADKFCKQVFKVFDRNASGEIDFSELMMSMSVTTIGNLRKKIELAFKLYDLDKNELIDKKELEKVLESILELIDYENEMKLKHIGPRSPTELVKSIMEKFDKNNDNHLSKEEFLQGCLSDPDLRETLVPYS